MSAHIPQGSKHRSSSRLSTGRSGQEVSSDTPGDLGTSADEQRPAALRGGGMSTPSPEPRALVSDRPGEGGPGPGHEASSSPRQALGSSQGCDLGSRCWLSAVYVCARCWHSCGVCECERVCMCVSEFRMCAASSSLC